MGVKHYHRHSAAVLRSSRWAVLRQQAKRRDDWKCRQCGGRDRIEVDHVLPVRTHPHLAYELSNLQCLCRTCHSAKTRREVGFGELDPRRRAWRDLVKLPPPPVEKGIEDA